jgi:hypothetical protein
MSGQAPLCQEKSPQGPQIIQNSPAGSDVEVELGEIVRDQEETLFAAGRAIAIGGRNFSFHIAARFFQGVSEHGYVLVRSLNIIKGRFWLMAHKYASRPFIGTASRKDLGFFILAQFYNR